MAKKSAAGKRENWSGHWGFVLAAAGSAIGLGNIWRFPYITGVNGGAAFILVYILCIALIGIPVMLCEVALGRNTQLNPVGCFDRLTPPASKLSRALAAGMAVTGLALLVLEQHGWGLALLLLSLLTFHRGWRLVGFMGVSTGFLILSYYSVIGGWGVAYIIKALAGGLGFESVAQARECQANFIGNPWLLAGYHTLFILTCTAIIYKGVQKGIELACKIMIPLLFLLMLAIIARALTLPGAMRGVSFCFSPDFSKLSPQSVMMALGQAFFTLSLGMGAMITYGSYLKKDENLLAACGWIVLLDTLVSLLACLMIFPAVFAMGFKPDEGPGLIFQVLPTVFHQLPLGALWAVLFFTLLSVAALTSGISLQEAVVAYLIDDRGWSRRRAALLSGLAILLVGGLCAFSFLNWDALPGLAALIAAAFGGARGSFFDLLDNLTCNWLLPLGGLFICVFTGWVWGIGQAAGEARGGAGGVLDRPLHRLFTKKQANQHAHSLKGAPTLTDGWGFLVRYVCPVAILLVFLQAIGLLGG